MYMSLSKGIISKIVLAVTLPFGIIDRILPILRKTISIALPVLLLKIGLVSV